MKIYPAPDSLSDRVGTRGFIITALLSAWISLAECSCIGKILMTHDIWINKMAQNEIFYYLRSRFSMYEIQMSTIHVDIHFLFSSAWPRGRATSMVQLIRELKHKLKVLPVLMSFSIFKLGFQRSNVSPKTAKSGNFEDQRWQVSWIFNSGIRSQRRLRLCTGLPRHQPLARFKG